MQLPLYRIPLFLIAGQIWSENSNQSTPWFLWSPMMISRVAEMEAAVGAAAAEVVMGLVALRVAMVVAAL